VSGAPTGRSEVAQELYRAFAAGDRDTVERMLGDDFTFSSPLDIGLDRAGYFERCWPGAGQGQPFEFVRVREVGEEVIVTYEIPGRGRNTEVLSFTDGQICAAEVYFGWDV
jgi:hypothetical protein